MTLTKFIYPNADLAPCVGHSAISRTIKKIIFQQNKFVSRESNSSQN